MGGDWIDTDGPEGEGFIVRDDAGIKTLADLQGKKIGYSRSSTAHYGLWRGLQENHIQDDQVTLLSMAPVQQVAAMRAGQIDAAEVWEPWMHTMVADAHGKLLANEADIHVRTAAGLFAVRREWLDAHRETAVRVLRAILMAAAEVKQDPQPVIDQFAKDTGITPAWSADVFKEAPPEDGARWTDPSYPGLTLLPDGSLQKALDGLASFMLQQRIVTKPLDLKNVIDASVITAAVKAEHKK